MKVRVLNPSWFKDRDKPPEGGDVITVSDNEGKAYIDAGIAESVAAKVEKATAAPGEKRAVTKPKAK